MKLRYGDKERLPRATESMVAKETEYIDSRSSCCYSEDIPVQPDLCQHCRLRVGVVPKFTADAGLTRWLPETSFNDAAALHGSFLHRTL